MATPALNAQCMQIINQLPPEVRPSFIQQATQPAFMNLTEDDRQQRLNAAVASFQASQQQKPASVVGSVVSVPLTAENLSAIQSHRSASERGSQAGSVHSRAPSAVGSVRSRAPSAVGSVRSRAPSAVGSVRSKVPSVRSQAPSVPPAPAAAPAGKADKPKINDKFMPAAPGGLPHLDSFKAGLPANKPPRPQAAAPVIKLNRRASVTYVKVESDGTPQA